MIRKDKFQVIVASNLKGVIGADNTIPWKSKEDLSYFKAFTHGKSIVMGRKTFESLGRKLPNRKHIVISRNDQYTYGPYQPDAVRTGLLDALFEFGLPHPLFLIGGSELIKLALDNDLVEGIYQTVVHDESDGDVFMPEIPEDFQLISNNYVATYSPALSFKVYKKEWLA